VKGEERARALKVKEARGKENRDREECTDAWGNKKEEKMANVSFMYILTWCQSIKHSFGGPFFRIYFFRSLA